MVTGSINNLEHNTIVKGDNKYISIAAASILAKTFRDEYMTELNEQYPQYGWKNNKGYATKYHIEAIRKFGITEYHRKTFCSAYKYQQTIIFKNEILNRKYVKLSPFLIYISM